MENMSTVQAFGEIIKGIYTFMVKCKFEVLDFETSLWELFLFSMFAGLIVLLLRGLLFYNN